jgi:uncharacterized protein (DUF1501 family)
LSLVPPLFDDDYYRMRPSLALRVGASERERRALDVGHAFGLHGDFAPLAGWFEDRSMSVVLAAGSEDQTRSHFEAQDLMELSGQSDGWLARALRARVNAVPSSLAAIAIGHAVPEALRGFAATAVSDISELVSGTPDDDQLDGILSLYAQLDDSSDERELRQGATSSVSALKSLRRLAGAPQPAGSFPDTALGKGLATAAQLLNHREELGLTAVTIDQDGWDTHFAQAGLVCDRVSDLARSLAALREALGDGWDHTTCLVMTEFGRRVQENVSLGADHGRASAMLLFGGQLPWAPFVGQWPGLSEAALEGPGDLRVTTNYREPLTWALQRLGVDPAQVFGPPQRGAAH